MVASEVNEPGGLRRCVREEGLAKAISRRESTLFFAIVNGEEKLAQDVARELSWRAESAWALL